MIDLKIKLQQTTEEDELLDEWADEVEALEELEKEAGIDTLPEEALNETWGEIEEEAQSA